MGEHLARSLRVRGKEEVSWEFRFMEKAEGKRESLGPQGRKSSKTCGFKSLRKEGFGWALLPSPLTVSQNKIPEF